MKRTEEHVKETKSFKIFADSIPDEWIHRRIEQDYALDFEVEIVVEGEVSGKTLLIQLKSSEVLSIENGTIDFQFETNKLQYYLKKDIPVILVLVDLKTKKSYWLFTQEYVYERIEKINPKWIQQKSITLKIPVDHEWIDSLTVLKDIAFEAPFYLAMKRISSIQAGTLLKWKRNMDTSTVLEDFKKQMTTKTQEIGLDLSYTYGKEGKPQESLATLLEVYKKSDAVSSIRMKAIAALLWCYVPVRLDENEQLFKLASEGMVLARKLKDESYFLYFKGNAIQTTFFRLVTKLGNELLLRKVSAQTKGSFMEPLLFLNASETMRKLMEVKSDFISTLSETEAKRKYYVFADLLRSFGLMQIFLYQTLAIWFDSDKMIDLLKSAQSALEFSLKIVETANQMEAKCIVLEDLALLYQVTGNVEMRRRALSECIEIAEKINHKGFAISAKTKYDLYEKAPPAIFSPKDIPKTTEEDFEKLTENEIDEMHRFLLQTAGIDVDGNDELAKIARVGLRDRNPERALKYCENLYVEIVTYGPIWDMVGLPSTGRKLLFCEKKGCLEGWQLDDVFESFKKTYCRDCGSHKPRPDDWKWTYRWQREKGTPEKMKDVLHKIRQQ